MLLRISQHVRSATLCYEIVNKTNFSSSRAGSVSVCVRQKRENSFGEPSIVGLDLFEVFTYEVPYT